MDCACAFILKLAAVRNGQLARHVIAAPVVTEFLVFGGCGFVCFASLASHWEYTGLCKVPGPCLPELGMAALRSIGGNAEGIVGRLAEETRCDLEISPDDQVMC